MTKASGLIGRTIQMIEATGKQGGRIGDILSQFVGDGLGARARRSSIWSFIDFAGSQGLRLFANLLLTRLLFPEAFGLMALVSVVMVGLSLFSDTGIQALIVQNDRGDDPDFLNTAWTVQAVRGLILWALVLVIAMPVAELYDEPQLAQILPIVGLTLLIGGLKPTSVYTVNRHLAIGRYVCIKLSAQLIGLMAVAVLAWQLKSVWALVVGHVITTLLSTASYHIFLPGLRNRFRIDADAAKQIFQFGKWIFLSTAAGFIINQGDRGILGLFVPLDVLGVYNVGYFLASVPISLTSALQQTVMRPLYRIKPPFDNDQNRAALFRARRLIALSMLAITSLLAFVGPGLVAILYDARYAGAGAMITLFTVSVAPMVCLNTIGAALIGVGDSRSMFVFVCTTAIFQTTFLLIGIRYFGVAGALIAPGLSVLASYPLQLIYSLKYRVFDPVQDIGFTLFGVLPPLIACVMHREQIWNLFVS